MVEVDGDVPFADLVFHVLAHVADTAGLAASLYDPVYVRFVESKLGAAAERDLGEDSAVLGRLLVTQERLIAVQRLAWLHRSAADSARWQALALAELAPDDAEPAPVLADLRRDHGDLVEVLRCAVALERPHHARLPAPRGATDALRGALSELASAAPFLRSATVRCLRSLRLRGRVFGRSISVGLPESEVGPSVQHAAYQAAHEATVAEILEAAGSGAALPEREVERGASWLFGSRCRRRGHGSAHRAWLATWCSPDAGGAPWSFSEDALSDPIRRIVRGLST